MGGGAGGEQRAPVIFVARVAQRGADPPEGAAAVAHSAPRLGPTASRCEFTPAIIIAKFGMGALLKWNDVLKWNYFLNGNHIRPNSEIIIAAVNSQLQRLQLTNRVTSYTTSGKRPPRAPWVDVFRTSNWQGPETVRKPSGGWTTSGRFL